jgi:hypothetical protein
LLFRILYLIIPSGVYQMNATKTAPFVRIVLEVTVCERIKGLKYSGIIKDINNPDVPSVEFSISFEDSLDTAESLPGFAKTLGEEASTVIAAYLNKVVPYEVRFLKTSKGQEIPENRQEIFGQVFFKSIAAAITLLREQQASEKSFRIPMICQEEAHQFSDPADEMMYIRHYAGLA